MANHELYVVQGKTLDNIAGTMRAVLGVDKDAPIRFDEVANSDKTEQINADVETQADLIAQIKTALEGKAAGNGSEIIAEVASLIDQSGVLESTDGSVEEKVEQLIDKAENENLWYEASKNIKTVDGTTNPIFANWAYSKLPRTDFGNVSSMSYGISFAQIEYIDFYINSSKCTNFNSAFYQNKKMRWMVGVDFSSATTIFDLFPGCGELETIQKPLNIPNVTNAKNAFDYLPKLKYIRFAKECIKVSIPFSHSGSLTAESIRSIFGGLNSEVTGQTLTIPRNAVKKAFETSEGANDGDTSAEWLALKDSKPNWTITLS